MLDLLLHTQEHMHKHELILANNSFNNRKIDWK